MYFDRDGKPITATRFGERYPTLKKARAGHDKWVGLVTTFEAGRWMLDCGENLHGIAARLGADTERVNDDAQVGLVVAKRRGTQDPGDQVVILTLRDLVALITGERPHA